MIAILTRRIPFRFLVDGDEIFPTSDLPHLTANSADLFLSYSHSFAVSHALSPNPLNRFPDCHPPPLKGKREGGWLRESSQQFFISFIKTLHFCSL